MPILKTIKIIIGVAIILIFGGVIVAFSTTPPNSTRGTITFHVDAGGGITQIGNSLKQNHAIYSTTVFKLQAFGADARNIQPGTYTIDLPAKPTQILSQLKEQSEIIRKRNLGLIKRDSVQVTIAEGKTADDIITILRDKGLDADGFKTLITTPNLDISSQYTFLPTPKNCNYGDYKTCIKYYYEGYLYPDTYEFYTDSTPQEILNKFLDNFENRVMGSVGNVSNDELFRILTKASIIEQETGRPFGITDTNKAELMQERKTISGIIDNRIDEGMLLQSDLTTYYGSGKIVCQRDRTIKDCIYLNDVALETLYNTYQHKGLPIGPITSPSVDVILASEYPMQSNYLFFAADITGKQYFAVTNAEHEANLTKIAQINASMN